MIEAVPKVAVWMAFGVAAFVVYKWLSARQAAPVTPYERDLNEVINSDKYKVKGRFED